MIRDAYGQTGPIGKNTKLKRVIRFYKRGSISDRTQLDQDLNPMALNLVVATITFWNTAYLDRALNALEAAACFFRM